MSRFQVSAEGLLRETSVHEEARQLEQLDPHVDAASLEAQMMLERTRGALADMVYRHWSKFGVTWQRYILLRILFVAGEGGRTMGEIAAEMNMGTNNMTQLVGGLVRDGLVERLGSAVDKRVIRAALTPQGRVVFTSVFPENQERIREAWEPLSEDEKRLLVHLLARVRVHLLADPLDAKSFPVSFPPPSSRTLNPAVKTAKRWQTRVLAG